jgi:uncharacterized repeat protein (TIGR03803 family)
MHVKNLSIWLRAVSLIPAVVVLLTSAWASDHETVLYSLDFELYGNSFSGSLVMDSAHNLYGATSGGGSGTNCYLGCGTIVEVSPGPHGAWTETVLHNFNGPDGIEPFFGLIMDAAGNLYGTTYGGGTHNLGTVFELMPNPDGGWTETVLYSFGTGPDGDSPIGGVIMDSTGNLYGTTTSRGAYGRGTVFELLPSSGGGWTETVLHNFGNGDDGIAPIGSLIMDAAGNLYGATNGGGQAGDGTVFQVSPAGGWTETVLHSFDANDGSGPSNGLVMDAAGNLYGTTNQGGNLGGLVCAPFGCGTVFEVSPVAGGGWTETTLYTFNGQPDAGYPLSSLILDAAGNLYGTTYFGGNDDYGTAFKLSPGQGRWTETVLYNFDPGNGGTLPAGGLIMDRAGDLYGETDAGGLNGGGVVYELTSPFICAARCASAVP